MYTDFRSVLSRIKNGKLLHFEVLTSYNLTIYSDFTTYIPGINTLII